MKNKRSMSIIDSINENVDLPSGVLLGETHIELNSNKEIIVDGRCSVIEYGDTQIRLNTKSGVLRITGLHLSIVTMSRSCVEIKGKISSVDFCE